MSKLVDLIDAYKDTHGQPSDASIARAIGIAPQTLSSWRKRGIRELPAVDTLRSLSRFIGQDYQSVIIPAVLEDIGYAEPDDPPAKGVRGA